jgi:hypothetical protein
MCVLLRSRGVGAASPRTCLENFALCLYFLNGVIIMSFYTYNYIS